MKHALLLFLLLQPLGWASAQFPPQAHQPGSDAVSASDSRILYWANSCTYERGWKNIADTGLGKPTVGDEYAAVGPPNQHVLSLGDGGSAVLRFDPPIRNGDGPDFVVFENGFLHPNDSTLAYLELAFVEVSSDGQHFVRFPATSLTQDTAQIDNFQWLDASKIHNLAGKYINGYGTPFDLEELNGQAGIDLDNITHVKIIDVVGSLHPDFGTQDAQGNRINDPYPSPYPSGGFDLNAVGVLNAQTTAIRQPNVEGRFRIFPNPAAERLILRAPDEKTVRYALFDLGGRKLYAGHFQKEAALSLTKFPRGIYHLIWENGSEHGSERIIKNK